MSKKVITEEGQGELLNEIVQKTIIYLYELLKKELEDKEFPEHVDYVNFINAIAATIPIPIVGNTIVSHVKPVKIKGMDDIKMDHLLELILGDFEEKMKKIRPHILEYVQRNLELLKKVTYLTPK